MSDVVSQMTAHVNRWIAADYTARESAVQVELTKRVQAAIESAVDNGPYGDASGHLGGDGFEDIAGAAVAVFVEFLRNPPVREVQADGTEKVRWP